MKKVEQKQQHSKQINLCIIIVLSVLLAVFLRGKMNIYAAESLTGQSLSVKQYINDDELTTLDNAILGQDYVLKVDAKSSYSNDNLKYVWYSYDEEGESDEELKETGSQITVQISENKDVTYGCEISDGNQKESFMFKLKPEVLADIEAFINGNTYDFTNETVGKDQSAILRLKVKTSSGAKPSYSWSKRDMSIPSSIGKEYVQVQNTKNTYTAKPTEDDYEEYRCIITVDGMSYTRYFYILRGTLDARGIVKVGNDILKKNNYGSYDVKDGEEVTLEVETRNSLSGAKLTYQWFIYDDDDIEDVELKGENKESYTYKANGYQTYYCLISNGQDSRKVYFTIWRDIPSSIQTEQYIQGEKTNSYIQDKLDETIQLKVNAASTTGEKLTYCWFIQTDNDYNPYGQTNKILQQGSNATYTLDCRQIKDKEIKICCQVYGEYYNEDDDESSDVEYCNFYIALKNYAADAKTFIQTATEEKETNSLTVPEGTALTLFVKPYQEGKNLTYTWYDKTARKQGEGNALSITKGSARDIYYCMVNDGNYTTRYTFTLNKEIICKHENIVKDEALAPTCTQEGLTEGTHCEDCGDIITEQKVIGALGHKWDEGIITRQPSITEEGIRIYHCQNDGCKEIKTEKIAKLPKQQEPSTENKTSITKNNTETAQRTLKAGTKIADKKTKAVYKVMANNTVQYTKASSKKVKNINIPSTITVNGVRCQVTAIASKAMKGNKKLTKVTIPASVRTIGTQAFAGCKNLKNITIQTQYLTKKSVGAGAFKGISAKAVIKVPKKQLKVYQKLLKSKGVSGKAKIRK